MHACLGETEINTVFRRFSMSCHAVATGTRPNDKKLSAEPSIPMTKGSWRSGVSDPVPLTFKLSCLMWLNCFLSAPPLLRPWSVAPGAVSGLLGANIRFLGAVLVFFCVFLLPMLACHFSLCPFSLLDLFMLHLGPGPADCAIK